MLDAEATRVEAGHLGERGQGAPAEPPEPGLAPVALGVGGRGAREADRREGDGAALLAVQPAPAAHRDLLPARVGPRPRGVGLPVCRGVGALEARPLLTRAARFAGRRGRRAVEHARGGRPHPLIEAQLRRGRDPARRPIAAIG